MFFGRLDVGEAGARSDNRTREWIQKPVRSHWGENYQIFMHYLQNIYTSPPGMGYDLDDGDGPFEDDKKLETFNAEGRYKNFDDWLQGQLKVYPTDNLFVTFGMDFEYMDAFKNYENMDRMINYFNTNHG